MAEQKTPAGGSQDAADSPDISGSSAAEAKIAATADAPSLSDSSVSADGDIDAANQAAIDDLLRQATQVKSNEPAVETAAANVSPIDLPTFSAGLGGTVSNIDLLRDVDLNVKIELGRSRMLVEDVLKLSEGSVVELDKPAGDPVDIFVNDRLVARGEVLVLNDNFCVRVNEIIAVAREESA